MPIAPVVLYRAAPGARFNNARAQRYGAFLADEVGLGRRPVAPEEIVEAAKPKGSPIHGEFTWNNREAAEQWRIEQARHLVSHIVISTPNDPSVEKAEVRAFHNVVVHDEQGERHRGYITGEVVWRTPDLADQVIAKALSELRGWTGRYRTYGALTHIIERIDDALAEEDEAA